MALKQSKEHESMYPDWTGGTPATAVKIRHQSLREGRFRLERVLGSGGMGEVHLAEDTTLHRKVAIKSVRADLCEDAEVRKRIERECLLHARVGPHTNIVTLYDRFEEHGQIRLVMEYVEGETLHARLRPESGSRHSLPLDEAVRIAVQVLDGLSRIHAHGIVHRDIKPSNIMLCKDDRGDTCAKLMDFGIARQTQDAAMSYITQTSYGSPGTPLYMAPEQIDRKQFGAVSPATDVYAMGVVLYQMVSGEPPFTGTITEIFNAHLNSRPSFTFTRKSPVPAMFVDILTKALAKRPGNRYPSAQAFRDDLQALSTEAMLGEAAAGVHSLLQATPHAPLRAPRTLSAATPFPEPSTSQRRFVKNRRRSSVVVLVAVTLALLGAWAPIGAYVWLRNRPEEPAQVTETPSAVVDAPAVEQKPVQKATADPPPMEAPEPERLLPPEAPAPVMDGPAEIPAPPPVPEIAQEPLPPLRAEPVSVGEATTPSAPVSALDFVTQARRPAAAEPVAPEPALAGQAPVLSEPLAPPVRTEPQVIEAAPAVEEPPADREPVRIDEAAPPQPPSAPELGFRVLGSESYRKN